MTQLVLKAIHFYQKQLSHRKPASCIFQPTCSTYALEAIQKYGLLKGGKLSAQRISRCKHNGKGGVDFVP
ncbi:membrane protein insertion efficiency factor YidD [Flavobacteriales bacterium]|nr:membrane protein insertion efficiency factor YidD [Flavobacteriales bacterium]